jgi:glycyl-tRNA synthetase
MFKTNIGPTVNSTGYLRPETAQGMFVNFHKLNEFNGGRMPMGVAQIGLGFRNEIAPRNQLLRVREFTMAEIEYFVDPLEKKHAKFASVRGLKLPLWSGKAQLANEQPVVMTIGEAVDQRLVDNELLGYFMARIHLFLLEAGVLEEGIRFRQHRPKEMAHYATDCWDAEICTSHGWVECVGCADRSAFDLEHHAAASGQKLMAARKFKEAVPK